MSRPGVQSILPNTTVNDTAAIPSVTVNNSGLSPTYSSNLDVQMEFYTRPAGTLTLGWFRKRITNYIINDVTMIEPGNDNGFEGQFEGYKILQSVNAGTAIAQGWEFAYQQQFRFLPGLLKTLRLSANFSVTNSHGDFGTTGAYRGNGEIAGFIPRTGNLAVSWDYKKFGVSMSYNYNSPLLNHFFYHSS